LLPVVPTRQEIKELYGYFSLMVIGTLSGVLRDEKDKLVLTTLFSPRWTAYYSISLRLIGFITLMNSFFYIPVVTAVGALNARGDWESIKRIYSNTIGIVAVTVGFTAVIIAGLHEQLLVLWMGKNIPEVGVILLWLVLGNITAILLVGPGAAICKGIGRLGMEAGFWGIGILINMILTIILIKTYGALGSVAASSLSWAVAAVFFMWFLHRNVALPWRFSFRSIKVLIIVLVSVVLVRIISAHWAIGVNRAETLWVTSLVALVTFVGYQALLVVAKIIPLSVEPFLFLLNRKNNNGHNISQSA
jgi:O-antigen/teichoic acid export membrane protein